MINLSVRLNPKLEYNLGISQEDVYFEWSKVYRIRIHLKKREKGLDPLATWKRIPGTEISQI